MKSKQKVLNILLESSNYVSGESIAKKLNISRVAVNKAVNSLRVDGYNILSVTNKGYLLTLSNEIDGNLVKFKSGYQGEVVVCNETASTNDDCKLLAEKGKSAVIIAKSQTLGRGRLNRKFFSELGGAYFSVLLTPNLPISSGVNITTYTAVVVARAIEKFSGLKVDIKWVNDLFVNGKKICGILTEASCDFEQNKLKYAVVGIGVNLDNASFDKSIENIATSVYNECGVKINKSDFIAEIVKNLLLCENEILSGNYLKEYKDRLFILGKTVTVYSGNESYDAVPIDITNTGALVVSKNGEIITVSSGEVSVKLK